MMDKGRRTKKKNTSKVITEFYEVEADKNKNKDTNEVERVSKRMRQRECGLRKDV